MTLGQKLAMKHQISEPKNRQSTTTRYLFLYCFIFENLFIHRQDQFEDEILFENGEPPKGCWHYFSKFIKGKKFAYLIHFTSMV